MRREGLVGASRTGHREELIFCFSATAVAGECKADEEYDLICFCRSL